MGVVVVCFVFGWGQVVKGFVEAVVVPPVHPFEGLELDLGDAGPCRPGEDEFGLVKAVDGLG